MQKRYRFRVPARFGESPAARIKRQKNWSYEESVTKHLLARFHRQKLGRQLWSEHKNKSPEDFGRLTLADFQRTSAFPVWLGARHISLRHKPSIGKLLREFGYTRMFGVFREVRQSVPEYMQGQPVCAIFPVPKIRFMALHTFESERVAGTTQIVIPHRPLDVVFTMEPLDGVLESLEASDLLTKLFPET